MVSEIVTPGMSALAIGNRLRRAKTAKDATKREYLILIIGYLQAGKMLLAAWNHIFHLHDKKSIFVFVRTRGRRSTASAIADVKSPFLYRERGFFHGFAQGGMRVNGPAKIFRAATELHHSDCLRDQFRSCMGKNVRA